MIGPLPEKRLMDIDGLGDDPDVYRSHGAEEDERNTEESEASIKTGAQFNQDKKKPDGKEKGAYYLESDIRHFSLAEKAVTC